MKKWQQVISTIILFVGILFISNSLYITIFATFALMIFFALSLRDKKSKQSKIVSEHERTFLNNVIEHFSKSNMELLRHEYNCFLEDSNNGCLLNIGADDENEILTNLKAYFTSTWFDQFVRIYTNEQLSFTGKKTKLMQLLKSYENKRSYDEKLQTSLIKNSKKCMFVSDILILVLVLLRVVFEERYILFASTLGGVIIITFSLFVALYSFEKNLLSLKGEQKNEKTS